MPNGKVSPVNSSNAQVTSVENETGFTAYGTFGLNSVEIAGAQVVKPDVEQATATDAWSPTVAENSTYANVSITSLLVARHAGTAMYGIYCKEARDATEAYYQELYKDVDPASVRKIEQFDDGLSARAKNYLTDTMIWRKAKFFQHACDAIEDKGFNQVLLLGDGINPMAIALAKQYPDVTIYCTDLDEKVMTRKQEIAEKIGLPNIHCFALDATIGSTGFQETLIKQGVQLDQPIYAQAEGLVYYLSLEAEKALIDNVCATHPETELIIDTFSKRVIERGTDYGRAHQEVTDRVNSFINVPNHQRFHAPFDLIEDHPNLVVSDVSNALEFVIDDLRYNPDVPIGPDFTFRVTKFTATKEGE